MQELNKELPGAWWEKPYCLQVKKSDIIKNDNQLLINVPEIKWLDSFPALQNAVRLYCGDNHKDHIISSGVISIPEKFMAKNQEMILKIPMLYSDKLVYSQAILPLGFGNENCLEKFIQDNPEDAKNNLKNYVDVYSSLVTFKADNINVHDRIYNTQHYQKFLSDKTAYLTGLVIIASKFPRLIAAGNACFDMLYNCMPLPKYLCLPVTDVCNLQCTICGAAQNKLHNKNFKTRALSRERLNNLAETLFPYMESVELNSNGEPTLHEYFAEIIETINKYGCILSLQTNATNISDKILNALKNSYGRIALSIDATGDIFEAQRVNAKWKNVCNNVEKLLRHRDPARLMVSISATITRRAMPDIINLCKWADDAGIDVIGFHYYNEFPAGGDIESCPDKLEKEKILASLLQYIKDARPRIAVTLQSRQLTENAVKFPSPKIRKFTKPNDFINRPRARHASNAHSRYVCPSPFVDCFIDLNGQFCACCHMTSRPLGAINNDQDFFDIWYGKDMNNLRETLRYQTDEDTIDTICHKNYVWPECKECVPYYEK